MHRELPSNVDLPDVIDLQQRTVAEQWKVIRNEESQIVVDTVADLEIL